MTRYTDLERINNGAYATLYRARDKTLGRTVAIKFFENPQTEDFVLLQARATVAIKNDHVVTIYDTAKLEHPKNGSTTDAIVMELVDGESLESRLINRPPSKSECLLIAEQLLVGVGWIADNEGIHQDLHAGNILLRNADSKVIIIDALGTLTQVFGRSRRRRIAHDLRSATGVLGDLLEVTNSEQVAEQFEEQASIATTTGQLRDLFASFLSGTAPPPSDIKRHKATGFSLETSPMERIPIGNSRENVRLTFRLVNSGTSVLKVLPAAMYFQPGENADRRWPLLDAAVSVDGVHNGSESMALRCTNYKVREIDPFSTSEISVLFDRPLTAKWKSLIGVIAFVDDSSVPQTFQVTVNGEFLSPRTHHVSRNELRCTIESLEVSTPSIAFYRLE